MTPKIKFLGNSSINKKGQIVIPLDARKNLDLNEKDKLLFFSAYDNMGFVVVKEDALADFMSEMNSELTAALKKQDAKNNSNKKKGK